MSLFMRDALGRLIPVNPGLPADRGNQGGMGDRLSEADLMSRLPDADIVGARGPGVVPGGEQSLGARRVALEAVDAANPPAPTFRPLGGAQQNNRGNARAVTLTVGSAMQNLSVPSIVETPKNSGDDAEAISVQLSIDIPEIMNSPASTYAQVPIDVVAVIEWGVGGCFFTAEMDWVQGTAFCICASYVRVSARVTGWSQAVAIGEADIDIVLRASLGYGNAESVNTSSCARRTVPVVTGAAFPTADILAAGDTSVIIPIPGWALGFTLVDAGGNLGAGPVSPDYTVTLLVDSAGNPNSVSTMYKVVDRSNLAVQVEGQFPIPGRARFVQITNNLAIGMVAPKLIFNLGF